MTDSYLIRGPIEEKALLLAHGAGADMQAAWLETWCGLLAAAGVGTIRFNFPYMKRAKKFPPDRMPVLIDSFAEAFDYWSMRLDRLVIGGKSLGGRVALNLALDLPVAGVCVLSYPLLGMGHELVRLERSLPLRQVCVPTLIVQGTRDPMGNPLHFEGVTISSCVEILWCQDANHDLEAPKKSGLESDLIWREAADRIAAFI